MGDLVGLFGQGLVVEVAGGFGVEGEVELVFPAEIKARARDRIMRTCAAGWPLARSAAWAASL